MRAFYKPDEMESDELDSELEMQGEVNEDFNFIGFADEDDERPQLARRYAADESNEESDVNLDVDISSDNSSDDDDIDYDNENMEDSDELDDSDAEEERTTRATRQSNNDNAPTTSTTDNGTDVDDEEDDVIKKILANSKAQRKNPPDIILDDFVVGLSFHPENDILAVGTMGGDALLYKYSVDGNELLNTLELHTKAIRDIQFSLEGNELLSTAKDRSIVLTDVETGAFKRIYEQAHDQPVSKLSIIDEYMFASGDDDGTVKLWDTRDKNNGPIFAVKEVDDYITAITTNDAKKVLVTTSGDGFLTAINIPSRKLLVQSEPYDEELTCMGLFRNDSKLVVGTSKGRLYTFNWNEFGYHNNMYPGPKTPMSHMIPVTDRVACVAGEEGVLRALHTIPGRNLGVVGQHSLAVDAMDINHSGEIIASSSDNNDIKFWNIKYFEELDDIKYNEKHNKSKEQKHNLPSSKIANAGDFFKDLV